jgi:hypothetical protein
MLVGVMNKLSTLNLYFALLLTDQSAPLWLVAVDSIELSAQKKACGLHKMSRL